MAENTPEPRCCIQFTLRTQPLSSTVYLPPFPFKNDTFKLIKNCSARENLFLFCPLHPILHPSSLFFFSSLANPILPISFHISFKSVPPFLYLLSRPFLLRSSFHILSKPPPPLLYLPSPPFLLFKSLLFPLLTTPSISPFFLISSSILSCFHPSHLLSCFLQTPSSSPIVTLFFFYAFDPNPILSFLSYPSFRTLFFFPFAAYLIFSYFSFSIILKSFALLLTSLFSYSSPSFPPSHLIPLSLFPAFLSHFPSLSPPVSFPSSSPSPTNPLSPIASLPHHQPSPPFL